ncbi:hypothetical protein EYF80_052974 [Liparis tanakae]|uniref:Uncharacterized protein n=1 Tax=Liparis tanakae TaxID=230148 RepID=A0A4Z2F7M5_9TELE|nr:hypothetical protein EYF80_052974 [Liparis tanakae]
MAATRTTTSITMAMKGFRGSWKLMTFSSMEHLHAAHRGADGVHRTAVIEASVSLRQVVHHKFGLALFVFDLIAKRLCNRGDLLLEKISKIGGLHCDAAALHLIPALPPEPSYVRCCVLITCPGALQCQIDRIQQFNFLGVTFTCMKSGSTDTALAQTRKEINESPLSHSVAPNLQQTDPEKRTRGSWWKLLMNTVCSSSMSSLVSIGMLSPPGELDSPPAEPYAGSWRDCPALSPKAVVVLGLVRPVLEGLEVVFRPGALAGAVRRAVGHQAGLQAAVTPHGPVQVQSGDERLANVDALGPVDRFVLHGGEGALKAHGEDQLLLWGRADPGVQAVLRQVAGQQVDPRLLRSLSVHLFGINIDVLQRGGEEEEEEDHSLHSHMFLIGETDEKRSALSFVFTPTC